MAQDGIDYQYDNIASNHNHKHNQKNYNNNNNERIDKIDNDEIYELPLTITTSPPSNKKLLCIAFVSFQTFAIVQLSVSIFAGSEAMFGDSIAMMVDALTYLFNLCAERQKEFYAIQLQEQQQQKQNESEFESESEPSSSHNHKKSSSSSLNSNNNIMVLKHQKYTYQLELIPPLLSVTALLVVTVIVLKESIHTLILDSTRDVSLQADPNINIMMIFSFLNLLLDVVNVGCFASAKHAMGYKTGTNDINMNMCTTATGNGNGNKTTTSGGSDEESIDNDNDENDMDFDSQGIELTNIGDCDDDDDNDDECGDDSDDETDESFQKKNFGTRLEDVDDDDDDNDDTSNLNMCSAYTHVFADTLRSFAVIFASLLAKFTNSVTSEIADACAAVVVSILIVLSLIPLIGGMVQTFNALRDVDRLLKSNESQENNENEEDQVELLRLL